VKTVAATLNVATLQDNIDTIVLPAPE